MNNIKKWYDEPSLDSGVIISSRVRLARNIKKYKFPLKISEEESKSLIDEVYNSIKISALKDEIKLIDIDNLSEINRNSMISYHSISHNFANSKKLKAVLLHDNETISIMINEEDHLRIQGISPGNSIDTAYKLTNQLDDLIEEKLEYAFDSDIGYLTSCPTNLGTGLRASYMLHLPCFSESGHLEKFTPDITKLGLTVRGIYGEGSGPRGNIYQISNQKTLGKSEEETLSILNDIVSQIVEKELLLQHHVIKTQKLKAEDNVYRAYATLSNARIITSSECMHLLSEIRFGFMSGILNVPKPSENVYKIMINSVANVVQSNMGKQMTEYERDVKRAEYLRKCFTNKED